MSTPSSPAFAGSPSSYADIASGTAANEVNAAYEDALDDVHTRFLLNLPPEELSTSDRIFFQLEQAWWFYDDFHCDNSKYALPRFKNVRAFAIKMFEYSPLLQPLQEEFDKMWAEFSAYKRKISTYGAILLNESCTKMVLCQVWKGNTWTVPAGKINQNEHGIDAAARETYEETGFDPNCILGVTKQMKEEADANGIPLPWKPLKDSDGLVFMDAGKRRTCYVCRGVPDAFPFEPVARKEVSAVEWHDLDDLPKKSFAVLPFMKQLRRWIKQNTRSQTPGKKNRGTTPGRKRSGSAKKSRSRNSSRSRNNSRGKVRENDPLAETGLATPGDTDGWTEEDMFKANEKLLGRKITYDGNPHLFTEKGFDEGDPHAFHVVGGSFMNSGVRALAPAPQQSKLQPLFRREDAPAEDEEGFKPFFSEGGETPWGDVVADALAEEAAAQSWNSPKYNDNESSKSEVSPTLQEPANIDAGQALLDMLTATSTVGETIRQQRPPASEFDVFLTDAQITARSQSAKVGTIPTKTSKSSRKSRGLSNLENVEYIQQWVKSLPKSPATKLFGDFHFDVDKIIEAMNLKA